MSVIKPYKYIPKEEIERRAVDVFQRIQQQRKRPLKWPLDSTVLAESLGLDVEWLCLPAEKEGTIAAMILPLERKILINEDIPNLHSGFGESTIAHEIGHWELHINQNAVGQIIERLDQGIEVAVEPFLCRAQSSQRWIEWQAQYFASCLLMPRFKLEEVRRGRNLTKWPHLYAMRDELGVTISNLTNRLQQLGWIYIPQGSKQIYPDCATASGLLNNHNRI
ncbi:MAG: ImmA/IrrE family metallo-endopeptidase [Symploca sp. SIO3E6]|nr:ImmA/IrrE family metallo-endopeptidase [Caldora sp. SIO3E6]